MASVNFLLSGEDDAAMMGVKVALFVKMRTNLILSFEDFALVSGVSGGLWQSRPCSGEKVRSAVSAGGPVRQVSARARRSLLIAPGVVPTAPVPPPPSPPPPLYPPPLPCRTRDQSRSELAIYGRNSTCLRASWRLSAPDVFPFCPADVSILRNWGWLTDDVLDVCLCIEGVEITHGCRTGYTISLGCWLWITWWVLGDHYVVRGWRLEELKWPAKLRLWCSAAALLSSRAEASGECEVTLLLNERDTYNNERPAPDAHYWSRLGWSRRHQYRHHLHHRRLCIRLRCRVGLGTRVVRSWPYMAETRPACGQVGGCPRLMCFHFVPLMSLSWGTGDGLRMMCWMCVSVLRELKLPTAAVLDILYRWGVGCELRDECWVIITWWGGGDWRNWNGQLSCGCDVVPRHFSLLVPKLPGNVR